VQPHPRSKVTVATGQLILLVEHRGEPRLARRTGVFERSHHPVAHLSVQRTFGKVLPAKFPVLRPMVHALDYREAVLKHQLVVGRLNAVLVTGFSVVERPVLRECFAGDVVVVDHDDVIVCFPAAAVGVRDDEDVRVGVHLLRKQIPEVVNALQVVGILRIELLVAERLPVVQNLDFTAGVLR
jgi:hypothetical protein